ncbi:transglycosylase SLT domain-containing protein [Paracoccus caeni]|uniref:Transglycosylase SLT domain-containing protein n=1 Tax=Paracoccus caeni TaxID=657651 RepID=A0A934SBP8_9RHOB|nr:transglycosylase SLT domain-containing protein [Paracoccus caeni]MBK4214329.1 transglycosylase SLT domain-containing protein [Paracoccus caeni]
MEVNAQGAGWQEFYNDRQSRCDSATDDALKKHFQAELDVARQTMQAMGLDVPEGQPTPEGQPNPEAAAPDGSEGLPGDAPGDAPGDLPEQPVNAATQPGDPDLPAGDPEELGYEDQARLDKYRGDLPPNQAAGNPDGQVPETPVGDPAGNPAGDPAGEPTGDIPAPVQNHQVTGDTPAVEDASPQYNNALEAFRSQILAASKATGIPPDVLAAMIWEESKGDPEAISNNAGNGKSDIGLMQINEDTFAEMKAKHPDLIKGDINDPESNIMAGALYLAEKKEEFGGDMDLALRAYNSGSESVDPANPDVSTTGLGTESYVDRVNYYHDLIKQGQDLPEEYPESPEQVQT